MNQSKNLILAIESAIGGGSLSIWEADREIDFWVGTSGISKAEDMLDGFNRLLIHNQLSKERVGLIAYSVEFGSPTGLKIGAALARGLSKSLNCRLSAVSLGNLLNNFSAEELKTGENFSRHIGELTCVYNTLQCV